MSRILLALTLLATVCVAQITVTGHGTATANAQRVVFRPSLTAEAELASDALNKFAAAKARAEKSLAGLELSALTVKGNGHTLKVGPVASADGMAGVVFMGAGGTPKADQDTVVTVAETLQVTLTGIQDMSTEARSKAIANILDAIKDAGMGFSGSGSQSDMSFFVSDRVTSSGTAQPSIAFEIDNSETLEQQAFAAAVADAKARAMRLAALTGVTLGKVSKITANSSSAGVTVGGSTVGRSVELSVSFEIQ